MTRVGVFTKLRCMAVPITTCRLSCAGSRRISAFTTSITCAVEFLAIDCRMCCGTIRSSLALDEITVLQSLRSVRLVLWDEERLQLVSFGEAALSGGHR